MEPPNTVQIVLLFVLIALSAFFSASETAFSSVNRIRLKNYAASGNRRAAKALHISDHYDRALSAILIGNNIVNIASASIGTVLFTAWFGPSGVGISTIVMTVLVLIFGEILPKTFAKDNAESFSLAVAGVLNLMMKVLAPIIALFVALKKLVSKKSGAQSEPSVTEEELKTIIEEIEDEGVLEKQESELVQSALEFDEIQAGEILTPRVDVLAVDITDSIQEIGELFLSTPYSRIPVFEKSIDNIVGVLHQREFFRSMVAGEPFTIADLLQETLHVPPSVKISALLRQMQLNKIQMAVVTDQYGGTLGVVTLEDIIEELVGDIWDESDIVTEAIQRIGENAYAVSGDTNVYDMFETIDCEYHGEEITSNSVSGWFLELLGRIPSKGESIDCAGLRLTVQDVDGKRIKKLTVQKLTGEPPAKEKE